MVDREARRNIAECLRGLASGLITNDEFEGRVPRGSRDPAIRAIFDAAWQLYSDFYTHKITLTKATKSEIARCILFLQTDLPYEWKEPKGVKELLLIVSSLLTFGLLMRIYRRSYSQQGDFSVWPFIRHADYQLALQNPVYLAGRKESLLSGEA
jgi:hypothetical protein